MSLLELDKVERSTFSSCLGNAFELVLPNVRVPLTLAEARALGSGRPGAREPFVLTFQGSPTLRLPQAIYRVEHTALGAMELFLVQVSADRGGTQFEAIFN